MALSPGRIVALGNCPHAARQPQTKSLQAVTITFEELLEVNSEEAADDFDEVSDATLEERVQQGMSFQVPSSVGLLGLVTANSPLQDLTLTQTATGEMDASGQPPSEGDETMAGAGRITDVVTLDTSKICHEEQGVAKMIRTAIGPRDLGTRAEEIGLDSYADRSNPGGSQPAWSGSRVSHISQERHDSSEKFELSRQEEQPDSKAMSKPEIAPPQITAADLQPARQITAQLEHLLRVDRVSPTTNPQQIQHAGDIRSLRLTLKPEHLGEVEIIIRRSGSEMHIRMVVKNEKTARILEGDMSLLREKIDQLMQGNGSPTVVVQVSALDENLSQPAGQQGKADGNSSTSSGNSLSDSGERQAPRKRDTGTRQIINDSQDRDQLLQPGTAHIIV
mgnify:CR=1 FL=1